jgi:hypothetical protein
MKINKTNLKTQAEKLKNEKTDEKFVILDYIFVP